MMIQTQVEFPLHVFLCFSFSPLLVLPVQQALLLSAGYFGNPEEFSRPVLLARAYRHFRAFCRANRIQCSQPEFKESHVPCTYSELGMGHSFF